MLTAIAIVSAIGFAISLGAYMVEWRVKKDPSYVPFCDFSSHIACSKSMKSEYTNLLFIPNALVACIFYIIVFVLAILHLPIALIIASLIACAFSAVCAYIQYYKIGSFCVLCGSLYLVNGILLLLSVKTW